MLKKPQGTLISIGGSEDRQGEHQILREVVKPALHKGHLVIIPTATQLYREVTADYLQTFHKLGVRHIEVLNIRRRDQAYDTKNLLRLRDASVIFFTGGDQLRLISLLAGTPIFYGIQDIYLHGGLVAGTSAGAMVMSEAVLIFNPANALAPLSLAPGLNLIQDVVIDSHFVQRGRIRRLLGAVARNPHLLGIGIDEDTAIMVQPDQTFRVIGAGAVYVVDGTDISYTSASDHQLDQFTSVHHTRLHVLAHGDHFDLFQRQPFSAKGSP